MASRATSIHGFLQTDSVIRRTGVRSRNRKRPARSVSAMRCSIVVETVSQRFDLHRGGGVQDLQLLLDRPQRLAQSLAGRDDDVGNVLARCNSLAVLMSGPHIAGRVAVQDRFGDEARSCAAVEIVPERLQRARTIRGR